MDKIDLSICIPTLNAQDYLKACLDSVAGFQSILNYEIIVVDNASADKTIEMLQEEYPEITLIRNSQNLGFSKAINRALHTAQGDYLLLLNPDTLLQEDAFTPQVEYLQAHSEVGISIPKILNADGSFQRQCRRGEATPIEVFGYFLHLGSLFPKNRSLNGYLQAWLPEDQIAEVKAVSGSCMFIRREAWLEVGDFDERFFAYQEDSDYCLRARQKNWKIMYVPITRVTHFSGHGGSKTQLYHSITQWHRSYYLYYRKHFAHKHNFLFKGFYYLAMLAKWILAIIKAFFRKVK